jgi:hypothetical protein
LAERGGRGIWSFNYWEYELELKQQTPISGKVATKTNKILKMIVEDEEIYDECSLFYMKGDPKTGDENARFGYLVVSNKIFRVPISILKTISNCKKLSDDGDIVTFSRKNIEDFHLVFEFPLYVGQRYGDLYELLRRDLMYTYVVSDKEQYNKKNKNKFDVLTMYSINRKYLNMEEQTMFIPTIGIYSYHYHHKGTIEDINYVLKSYKIQGIDSTLN